MLVLVLVQVRHLKLLKVGVMLLVSTSVVHSHWSRSVEALIGDGVAKPALIYAIKTQRKARTVSEGGLRVP